jgi:hypothetical protein
MIRQSVSGLATRSCASFKKWERDRTQNRRPLLLIALTHAPLLKMLGRHLIQRENQKLAQLFMICSNIKLTSPGESIGIGGLAFHK